jgi:arylformamidase
MIDITRVLYDGHPNWPGDVALKLSVTALMKDGSSANIMNMATSMHCGTHIDAPYHYLLDGARLESITLDTLVGPCLVIHAKQSEPLGVGVIEGFTTLPERVLFYTGQPERWNEFPRDFTPLSIELVEALAAKGVKLVGTDCPSVDHFSSKDLPVHNAFGRTGLYILEGLNLTQVPAGKHELTCLPLSIPYADGSPVRAILR